MELAPQRDYYFFNTVTEKREQFTITPILMIISGSACQLYSKARRRRNNVAFLPYLHLSIRRRYVRSQAQTFRAQPGTERRGRVDNTPTSYSGYPGFKSRPQHRLS